MRSQQKVEILRRHYSVECVSRGIEHYCICVCIKDALPLVDVIVVFRCIKPCDKTFDLVRGRIRNPFPVNGVKFNIVYL